MVSNMSRYELREKYTCKVLQTHATERQRGRTQITELALCYLNTVSPRTRFCQVTLRVLESNIYSETPFNLAAAKTVFNIAENYVINLLDCPWKPEFRKITMYSGFYKTRVEPYLKEFVELLTIVGYEKVGMCLELRHLPDTDKLQDVALEFFLASLECKLYEDVLQKIASFEVCLRDIHRYRTTISCDLDALIGLLLSKELMSSGDTQGYPVKFQGENTKVPKHGGHGILQKAHSENQKLPPDFESGYDRILEDKVPDEIGSQQTGFEARGSLQTHQDTSTVNREKTDSLEAMLRDITPEMISDVNFRKQIVTKLKREGIKIGVESSDKMQHISLPQSKMPWNIPVDSRPLPYTEPICIPKQQHRSPLQPYTEPIRTPKEQHKMPLQPYTEPICIPKQQHNINGHTWICKDCHCKNSSNLKCQRCGQWQSKE